MTRQELIDALIDAGFSHVEEMFEFIESHDFTITQVTPMISKEEKAAHDAQQQARREKISRECCGND